MTMILLDTTVLIDLTKNNKTVLQKLRELENEHTFYTTQVNVYEVLYGIYAAKFDSGTYDKRLNTYMDLFSSIKILDMTLQGTSEAARIGGTLCKEGRMIEDTDCLTAGIALAHGVTRILTRNAEHFSRIKGLTIITY